MKLHIINNFKKIIIDRQITAMIVLLIVLSIVYCLYIAISLKPSQLQVAVHYTTFGETFYYRDKWYYLLNFIFFAISITIINILLVIKLIIMDRRGLAFIFAWFSVLVFIVAFFITRSVIGIAFL